MDSNNFIKHITLENYKSIKKLDLELKPLNVLIGSNGAGKSNLISFFSFLQNIIKENLRGYVLDKGGQETFLYYGSKTSVFIYAKIDFVYESYDFTLIPTLANILAFKNEAFVKYTNEQRALPNTGFSTHLNLESAKLDIDDIYNLTSTQHADYETRINKIIKYDSKQPCDEDDTVLQVRNNLSNIQVFHFNDTSDTSPLKATIANNDNLFLRADGQNLACMVKLIYDKHPEYYKMIVDTIRNVVPDFHDFVIRHNSEFLSLEWFNKNNVDIPWKAHYLSDGSLRFIALAVLLLMPSELQPQVIIIDEPEIGLHPTALNVLSGLIKRASLERQVIISTQSATLLSQFEPDDVIVVDKKDKYSEFRRLSNHDLANWLESYTLGELWETNVIGGRP